MASEVIVKQERLDEPSPAGTALTPVSVKLERQEVQAESSTSNRRRSARRIPVPPSPETESEELKPDDDEVYVVGGIVAKSLNKGDGPWGAEHQYLIRWEGYGPKDDTWEWTSNVAQNARQMIDEFDKKEHPFNIVDSSAHSSDRRWLVESCAKRGSGSGLWSPLAERGWMTASQIHVRRRVGKESTERAIQEWKTRPLPTPPSSARGLKRGHVFDDEEEDEEEDYQNIVMDRKRYTERVLLDILDENRYRKHNTPWKTRYRVRHYLKDRIRGYQTKEEWYTNKWLLLLFGPKVVHEKLKAYMPEPKPGAFTRDDGQIVPDNEISDYEKDRLRRMKENEDLMKKLGLAL